VPNSAEKEARKAALCLRVVDKVFGLFDLYDLDNGDGLYTLSVLLARVIQTECDTTIERDAMADAVMQIVRREITSMDEIKESA
jgi:hypothetical protein